MGSIPSAPAAPSAGAPPPPRSAVRPTLRITPTAPSIGRANAVSLPVPRPASAVALPRPSGSSTPLPRTLQNGQITVVLDPGHGGRDPGAVGIDSIHEADIVLPIAQQVAALLEQQGIRAVMTRTDDREVGLEPRVQTAERQRARLFVSIHANSISLDRPDVNGVETYYYSSGEDFAEITQNTIVQTLDMKNRGVKQARFYVLRETTMPSILVEVGFVTGNQDQPRLADAAFRSQMATTIAHCILQYLQR